MSNQERQTAYRQVVQALLECPQNDEQRILAANPDLVDEGLVKALKDKTMMMMRRNSPELGATMQRLVNVAQQLERKLAAAQSVTVELDEEDYIRFSFELFQIVAKSKGDGAIVHQFCDEHRAYFNEQLLAIFPQSIAALLERSADPDRQVYIRSIAQLLAIDLQTYPRVDRSILRQLSIACKEQSLLVHSQTDEPIDLTETKIEPETEPEPELEPTESELEPVEIEIDLPPAAETKPTNEDPQITTHFQLVQALLECRLNEEERVLAAHPELVDEGLIRALLVTAETLKEINNPESAGPIEWAEAFAAQLSQKLGLQLDTIRSRNDGESEDFFLDLIQAVANSRGDKEIVYKFLDGHLDCLNKKLLAVIPQSIAGLLERQKDPERQAYIHSIVQTLAVELQTYPKGDRSINLALSIACQEQSLLVHSQPDEPIDLTETEIEPIETEPDIESAEIDIDRLPHAETMLIDENHQITTHFQLVQALLECPLNEENRLLAAHPELVDEGLVRALLSAAENIKEINNPDSVWAIEWLESFAAQLSQKLGLQQEANQQTDDEESDRFSLDLLQTVADRQGDGAIVHQFFDETQADLPIDRAATQHNLALADEDRIKGDSPEENLETAVKGYESVFLIHTPKTLPIDALETSCNLADIYFSQGSWQLALNNYEIAMQSVETSRDWVVDEQRRQELLEGALSVYENAIQCAINLQNYPQAIQYTERSRSRQLVELTAQQDLSAAAAISPEIAPYLAEYQALNRNIENLRQQDSTATDTIDTLEQQKTALYLKIRSLDPAIAGQIQVETIDYATIQQLIHNPHTAILTCYTTKDDTHIFIIKQSGTPTIHTCKTQGWQTFQKWLQKTWINPSRQHNSTWAKDLPRLLHEIAHRLELDTLIEQHLTNINELILVPHLNLHQIPFAALPIGEDGEDGEGREDIERVRTLSSHTPHTSPSSHTPHTPHTQKGGLLGDKFIIRSIPSCQILQYCQLRPPVATAHMGTVEDADDTLLSARYEGAIVAGIYKIPPTDRLRGSSQATAANYRALLARVNRLHSTHHAGSNLDNPLESALLLAPGEKITLGDLLMGERYPNLDEVFLSACQTHIGKATFTDDIATLTTGFLCIGARAVQNTLWSVDDYVSVIFNVMYHQERCKGTNRAISLHTAQSQLRNLTGAEFQRTYYPHAIDYVTKYHPTLQTALEKHLEPYCAMDKPFESPYYWAAFITQGMA